MGKHTKKLNNGESQSSQTSSDSQSDDDEFLNDKYIKRTVRAFIFIKRVCTRIVKKIRKLMSGCRKKA